ncbi:MAG: zinc ribbon domain-containing protein [Candidatus Obscuribacterales bacterium]|nr:zinc ribbon domain-containing protein [Candidatus Obscuribacterales bacterium]
MSYSSTTMPMVTGIFGCSNCSDILEPEAKFCGGCGFIVAPTTFNINQYPEYQETLSESSGPPPVSLPGFATAGIPVDNQRNKQLIEEANKLMVLLARERLFLYMHWLFFIAVNLFGIWVAWKSYFDFVGDEMSKMMVASTPFLFINSMALMSLVPIKGTRSEIARLNERLSYVRFNIEFGHLNL